MYLSGAENKNNNNKLYLLYLNTQLKNANVYKIRFQ